MAAMSGLLIRAGSIPRRRRTMGRMVRLTVPKVITAAMQAHATKDERPPAPKLGPERDEFLAVMAGAYAVGQTYKTEAESMYLEANQQYVQDAQTLLRLDELNVEVQSGDAATSTNLPITRGSTE